MVTLYQLLQVTPNADPDVIDAAAKALIKKAHPDVKDGDTATTKDLIKARTILTNQEKRQEYDAKLRKAHGNEIGGYAVIRKIAEGGFGRVYEARHMLLDEKVCIKHNINVSDFDTKMFIKEAKSIWHLRHHALPAVRDFVMLDDGSCALVMSFIEGPTLMQLVKGQEDGSVDEPLNAETACWIAGRVLDALRYLHFNGVVHGDVKPQNVIIQPDVHSCALVDFGLSAIKPTKGTKPEGFTPMFASPEALADKPLLPESDLYSLGVTLIYALGGDPIAKRIPSSVPAPVRDFISDLVVHDVNERPHWAKRDLLAELNKARRAAFGREHSLREDK